MSVLTKSEFCTAYIRQFCEEYDLKRSELTDPENIRDFVMLYPKLGICMEYLNMITDPELLQFTENAMSVFSHYVDTENSSIKIMTIRELIELLPD